MLRNKSLCGLQRFSNDSLCLLYIIVLFLTPGMNQTTDLEDPNNPLHAKAMAPSGMSSDIHDRKPKNSQAHSMHKLHTGVKAIHMRANNDKQ